MCADHLERWGLSPQVEQLANQVGARREELGRVVSEHRGQWVVVTDQTEVRATLTSGARDQGQEEGGLWPTVGDWVALRAERGATNMVAIDRVLPRTTKLSRRSPADPSDEQMLVANIDYLFVVSATGRDVSAARLLRFVAMATAGGVTPVAVLTKADLCDDPFPYVKMAEAAAPGIAVHVVSALRGVGMEALTPYLTARSTVALLGTSGAGKSTLVNWWLGDQKQATGQVREDGKGRHTTVRRQLFPVPQGGIVVDTPGLREVGLWGDDEALLRAFDDIEEASHGCRYRDCEHRSEPGCAVLQAVSDGRIDPWRWRSWKALQDEVRLHHKQRSAQTDPSRGSGPATGRAARMRLRHRSR